jgi:outer membrane protein assembly factor BamB
VAASPVVARGRVFVGSFDGAFYAIDLDTGQEVWRFDGASNWYWASALVVEDTVYAPSLDGNLYALDIDTGALRWTLETEGRIVGSPAVVFDMIAVASDDGHIRLTDLAGDGSVLRRCNIEEKIRTSLVANEGVIFFGADDKSIRTLVVERGGRVEGDWVHFTDEGEIASWACVGPT